jgi:hypothetical protein
MSALTASTALALNASKQAVSVTNTGTGNNVLSASPTLTGTIDAAAQTLSGNLTLSGGTANGVLYLNGSKVATSGSALTFDGTNFGTTGNANLGSGSKSTDTQLNFASDLGTQRIFLDRGTRSLVFYDATTAIENYRIAGITGVQTWGVGGSEQMRLNSTGLGIGTSSPGERLDVATSSGDCIIRVGNGTSQARFAVDSDGPYIYPLTSGDLSLRVFTAAGTQAMTLDASGNLGIGTTSPSGRLDIRASGAVQQYIISTSATSQENVIVSLANNGTIYSSMNFDSADYKFKTSGTERARITAAGELLVGKTSVGFTAGVSVEGIGVVNSSRDGGPSGYFNRNTNDGAIVVFVQDGTEEGSISVSGNTISYNAFAGSHWSQLQDGSKPDILRGTVMESINELCVWPDEQNERLPKSKVSDTAGSKKVYGVFMAWDNDWATTNDMYVTAVGAFICRVNASVTVQEGDLLESNGDGTARVQADDIIRSSTIGKVTSTVKTHQYDDGSYCVPTVLYCG